MIIGSKNAPRRVRFLASVTSVEEARIAVAAGADLIDCKAPSQGALGALPLSLVARIRMVVGTAIPVSATVGDRAPSSLDVERLVVETARTGVDFVKIGLYPDNDIEAAIVRLAGLDLGRARLVAVMLADLEPDFSLIGKLASAGFAGVMLDTALKDGRALPAVLAVPKLSEFVRECRANSMLCGLAGSLRAEHVAALVDLRPDLLGFRGALCRGTNRTAAIDSDAVHSVASAISSRCGMHFGVQSPVDAIVKVHEF